MEVWIELAVQGLNDLDPYFLQGRLKEPKDDLEPLGDSLCLRCGPGGGEGPLQAVQDWQEFQDQCLVRELHELASLAHHPLLVVLELRMEIGRASCRERG